MKIRKLTIATALVIFTFGVNSIYAQENKKVVPPKDNTGSMEQSKAKLNNTTSVYYTCPMHKEVKSDKQGKCPKCGMDLVKVDNSTTSEIYICPKHENVKSSKPGKCPFCKSDLVKKELKKREVPREKLKR